MTVCVTLTDEKMVCSLLGKDLCQVVLELRRFCLPTIEMREQL
jgi:hypothetical protein